MGVVRVWDRAALGWLGSRSVAKQLPRADERRPRPARIVRQPEPIRPKDKVIADDHLSLRLAATRRYSVAERVAADPHPPIHTPTAQRPPLRTTSAPPLTPFSSPLH